jgi:chromate reductase
MRTYQIFGICGSLRTQSFNLSALKAAGELMPQGMQLSGHTNLLDLPMYNPDHEAQGYPDSVCALRDQILAADGLLISTPEYNWTMSASLKNAIDWISRFKTPQSPFHNKPCAVLSATTGPLGGARVQYDVRRSMSSVGALFLQRPEVFIGMAGQKFDAQGQLTDATTRDFISAQMKAFAQWIDWNQPPA